MLTPALIGCLSAHAAAVISDAAVILHLDGANDSTAIIDATGKTSWSATSPSKLSTVQAKFGPSSLLCGGYVSTPNLGGIFTSDFCVEGFALSTSSSTRGMFHTNPDSSARGLALGWDGSSQRWQLYHDNAVDNSASTTLPSGWFHWAVFRVGSTLRVAIDGTTIITVTEASNLGNYTAMTLGLYYNTGYPWVGYIDEFRIMLGSSPYTTDTFTPPASPFT